MLAASSGLEAPPLGDCERGLGIAAGGDRSGGVARFQGQDPLRDRRTSARYATKDGVGLQLGL